MVSQASGATVRRGSALVGLALLAVVVAYPPPATGLAPLFGVGNVFLPLGVAVCALLAAAVGGFLLAPAVAEQVSSLPSQAVRLLAPASALALVDAYLVTVAGFF